jgi:SAM-dependent methyltransferase
VPGKLSDRLWGPLFARGYDSLVKSSEEAGLRDKRRDLLARARGRTLEIGAGTGINLALYPEAVTELVLTEPDPHMRAQLEKKLALLGRRAELIDTVVATLVLCTIPDPEAALGEIARVLKPDGQFLFLEHVRASDPKTARWQDRLERPWGWFGRGCHPNRDTLAAISASALDVSEVEQGDLPKAPPIVRPLIAGEAKPPAS